MTSKESIVTMLGSTLAARASHALLTKLEQTVQSCPPTDDGLAEGCRRVIVAVRMFVGEPEARSLSVRLAAMGVRTESRS